MTIQRWRVEFEDKAGHLAYMVLRTIAITDGTVAEIIECGPSALFRGYPVFVKTVKVGAKPIVFLQGKWRMLRAKVLTVTELEYQDALLVPKREHERSGEDTARGRNGVRRPVQRTGTRRAVKGRRKEA